MTTLPTAEYWMPVNLDNAYIEQAAGMCENKYLYAPPLLERL
jgi:hypothetical protein